MSSNDHHEPSFDSHDDDSISVIDPEVDHVAAIRQLQTMLRELQIKHEQLDEQFYVLKHTLHESTHPSSTLSNQPKFYAVLRGHFDHSNDTFMRGIYDDIDEVNVITKGAWKADFRSFGTRSEAEAYFDEHIDGILHENSQFFNPQGEFSKRWYAVWTRNPQWHQIVSTSDEADALFSHKPDCQRKHFPTYAAAADYLLTAFS